MYERIVVAAIAAKIGFAAAELIGAACYLIIGLIYISHWNKKA